MYYECCITGIFNLTSQHAILVKVTSLTKQCLQLSGNIKAAYVYRLYKYNRLLPLSYCCVSVYWYS